MSVVKLADKGIKRSVKKCFDSVVLHTLTCTNQLQCLLVICSTSKIRRLFVEHGCPNQSDPTAYHVHCHKF